MSRCWLGVCDALRGHHSESSRLLRVSPLVECRKVVNSLFKVCRNSEDGSITQICNIVMEISEERKTLTENQMGQEQ